MQGGLPSASRDERAEPPKPGVLPLGDRGGPGVCARGPATPAFLPSNTRARGRQPPLRPPSPGAPEEGGCSAGPGLQPRPPCALSDHVPPSSARAGPSWLSGVPARTRCGNHPPACLARATGLGRAGEGAVRPPARGSLCLPARCTYKVGGQDGATAASLLSWALASAQSLLRPLLGRKATAAVSIFISKTVLARRSPGPHPPGTREVLPPPCSGAGPRSGWRDGVGRREAACTPARKTLSWAALWLLTLPGPARLL